MSEEVIDKALEGPSHSRRYEVAATLDFFAKQSLVEANGFRHQATERAPLPTFEASRELLPEPYWEGHEDAIAMYWHTWELAFSNLRTPPSRMHVSNYIDTAFNSCLFLWDSVFILHFAKYGARVFNFQNTLDNLYANQLEDGFITRELRADGTFQFHPHDPASTGPNILAWSEWTHYLLSGDRERLAKVFPVILAYHRWLRFNRSWPDGTYYSCGLACGMDNMRRMGDGYEPHVHHGHLSWVDATSQAALSCDCLIKMAKVLDCTSAVEAEELEYTQLAEWVKKQSWHQGVGFSCDVDRKGEPTGVKQVGGYWAMLAGLLSEDQANTMAEHLDDPKSFNRHHRVPTMAADQPDYREEGNYWNGSVWAPTTWMVLKALDRYRKDDLAYDIAANHHENVLRVWKETGTVWENYAPESDKPGKPAKPDFVGWTGLPPIAVLFEHLFGLRQYASENTLVWDVRQTAGHGVKKYPFAKTGLIELQCAARGFEGEEPKITVKSNVAFKLELRWAGGQRTIAIQPDESLG